jgi:branched-chain amino acid transport system substrate-binding protein
MNPTAVKEAIKIGFPMDRLVGVWWSGSDDDARPEAKGYSSLSINGVGQNYPAIEDILKYVVDKGKSQIASKDKVGENLYNRAVLNAALIADAIRSAQILTARNRSMATTCAGASRRSVSPMPAGRRLVCRGLRRRSI